MDPRYHAAMRAGGPKLEMLQRHGREGETCVTGQRALIARPETSGLPTDEAEALLVIFEDAQRQHEAHLTQVGNGLG